VLTGKIGGGGSTRVWKKGQTFEIENGETRPGENTTKPKGKKKAGGEKDPLTESFFESKRETLKGLEKKRKKPRGKIKNLKEGMLGETKDLERKR